MFICASCNVRMPILPHGKLITEKITEALVRLPFKLDGHAIRFLRKSMGLKSEDLAERIGVHRVEVSRWENDKASIDPYHDLKLRILAITFVLPSVEQDKAKEEIMNILEHENIEKKVTSTPRILVPA